MFVASPESLAHALTDASLLRGPRDAQDTVVAAVNAYQASPARLISKLALVFKCLKLCEFDSPQDAKIKTRVFYELCKVAGWKHCYLHIRLPRELELDGQYHQFFEDTANILEEASDPGNLLESTYQKFYHLCALYLLLHSPWQFPRRTIDRILRIVVFATQLIAQPLLTPVCVKVVSKIMLNYYHDDTSYLTTLALIDDYGPSLWYDFCKRSWPLMAHYQLTIQTWKRSDISSHDKLRLLPHVGHASIMKEDWNLLQELIDFLFDQRRLESVTLRFKLSKVHLKFLNLINHERYLKTPLPFDMNALTRQLVTRNLNDIKEVQDYSRWDLLDIDFLHSNLLVIASTIRYLDISAKDEDDSNFLNIFLKNLWDSVLPFTIIFQQRHLTYLKGSQIRDASAYICWTSARLKNVKLSNLIISKMFHNLLMAMNFDDEFINRRSFNAALQELLGRYGHQFLSSRQIMDLMELPNSDLKRSAIDNTLVIVDIMESNDEGMNNDKYSCLFHYLVYNLLWMNRNIETVWLAVECLKRLMVDKALVINKAEELVPIFELIDKKKCSAFQISKILYVLIELDSISPSGLDDIRQLVPKMMDQILDTENVIGLYYDNQFVELALLQYYRWSLTSLNFATDYKLGHDETALLFSVFKRNGILKKSKSKDVYHKIHTLAQTIISIVSRRGSEAFQSEEVYIQFWSQFKSASKIGNLLVINCMQDLVWHQYYQYFWEYAPSLDYERKSILLKNLSHKWKEIMANQKTEEFQAFIVDHLDDYTITEQGDVGREVRRSAIKLLEKILGQITSSETKTLNNLIISKLFRLSAEDPIDIGLIAFRLLHEMLQVEYNPKISIDDIPADNIEENYEAFVRELLIFQYCYYKRYEQFSSDFWQGFMNSAGSIFSSPVQFQVKIDAFLKYYDNIEDLEIATKLCHDMFKAIPSYKELIALKDHAGTKIVKETSITFFNIEKQALYSLNFWKRILESNFKLPQEFKLWAAYGKLHNLSVMHAGTKISTAANSLVPYLFECYSRSLLDIQYDFHELVNCFIKNILNIIHIAFKRRKQEYLKTIQFETYRDSLIQLYLTFDKEKKLQLLLEYLGHPDDSQMIKNLALSIKQSQSTL